MTTVIEPTQQSESVIAVVRKEGEDMSAIAPADTRCHADVEGKRCESDIAFSMETKSWSQMCEEHTNQNLLARSNEATKVKKFVEAQA